MNKRIIALLLLAAFALSACSEAPVESSATDTAPTSEVTENSTEDTTEATTVATTAMTTVPFESVPQPEDAEVPEGYHFVWGDEFDGDALSNMWTRESHPSHWVNNELQVYDTSEDYSYVSDGNLIIQPAKVVDDNGNVTYYS